MRRFSESPPGKNAADQHAETVAIVRWLREVKTISPPKGAKSARRQDSSSAYASLRSLRRNAQGAE